MAAPELGMPNSARTKHRTFKQKWRLVSINNKLVVIFAGISTVAAVIYSGFAGWQLYEIHKGSADTHTLVQAADTQAKKMTSMSEAADKIRKASEDMVAQDKLIAENAKKALEASNTQSSQALNATIANFQQDQRAWVVAKGIGGQPKLDQPWTIEVQFTNTGRTPAKNAEFSCNTTPLKSEDDLTFKPVPFGRPTLVAPQDQSSCVLEPMTIPKVTQQVLDFLQRRDLTVFVYGSVIYEDVFGKHHWLKFCRAMSPDGSRWENCSKYNDTGDGEIPK
jgi:hypothetical protein